jgi:hypothetical protein
MNAIGSVMPWKNGHEDLEKIQWLSISKQIYSANIAHFEKGTKNGSLFLMLEMYSHQKPHCIQSSRVLY